GRSRKEQLHDELAAIAAQIRHAEDGTARREYARVLADLERVRAESAALQSGTAGAETDQHLLDSADSARELSLRWKAAADQVAHLVSQVPTHRMDPDTVARVRWYPDAVPSDLHVLLERVARARADRDRLELRIRDLATSKLPEPSDRHVIDLATANQTELWAAAAAVTEAARELSREQVAMGGLSSPAAQHYEGASETNDVIGRIEAAHRVVEELEGVADRRRVPAISGAGIVAVTSLIFAPATPLVA